MPINVHLLDHTSDPMRSPYIAYRTAYSALTPQTIADFKVIEEIGSSVATAGGAKPAPNGRDGTPPLPQTRDEG